MQAVKEKSFQAMEESPRTASRCFMFNSPSCVWPDGQIGNHLISNPVHVTIFSDMVPRLLSNVGVATPFYQLPAFHVYSFLHNLLYIVDAQDGAKAASCGNRKAPPREAAVDCSPSNRQRNKGPVIE